MTITDNKPTFIEVTTSASGATVAGNSATNNKSLYPLHKELADYHAKFPMEPHIDAIGLLTEFDSVKSKLDAATRALEEIIKTEESFHDATLLASIAEDALLKLINESEEK